MILFPAIDLKDGKCVRLLRGDMARATVFVNRRSIGTPDRRAKGTPVGARGGDARSRLA